MELKMNEFKLPEQILFNYDELKKELTEKVSMYETLVYTDDQIKEAKADKANLNKLKKALNDERIRIEKEYMQPFNDFKAKINEIISIIDKPVAVIDKQVKAYEDKKKQEKLDAITAYFNGTDHPEWLHMSQIFDERWVNASVSMKSVQESMNERLDQIELNLTTLHDLPEFGFEATEVYKTTLDMNKAISEAQKMSQIAKAKAEAEAKKAEYEATQAANLAEKMAEAEFAKNMNPPVEEPKTTENGSITEEIQENEPVKTTDGNKQWVKFQALLSTDDALALKEFFNSRNIEFMAV